MIEVLVEIEVTGRMGKTSSDRLSLAPDADYNVAQASKATYHIGLINYKDWMRNPLQNKR